MVERAATLPNDGSATEDVPFVLSDEARPLLRFDDAEAFERMAEAVVRVAQADGKPIRIQKALRAFTAPEYGISIPRGGLALTDANGRVVVGDRMYALRLTDGKPESVIRVLGSNIIENVIPLRAKVDLHEVSASVSSDTLISSENGRLYASKISRDAEDSFGYTDWQFIYNASGQRLYAWMVFASSGYVTYINSKVANAQTELWASTVNDRPNATTIRLSALPSNASKSMFTVVYTYREDLERCVSYGNQINPQNNKYMYQVVDGPRSPGRNVANSSHAVNVGSVGFAADLPGLNPTDC